MDKNNGLSSALSETPLVILAGGLGTRLRKEIASVPKPLAPILNKPFLQLLIENYYSQGIRIFIFSLHYKSQMVIDSMSEVFKSEMKEAQVHFVVEPELLGTGGAIRFVVEELKLEKPFLVTNSDTWNEKNIAPLLSTQPPAISLLQVSENTRYGKVEIEKGKITSFTEKDGKEGEALINTGLYFLKPENILSIQEKKFSMEKDLFPKLACKGVLGAKVVQSNFIDIGIPEDYRRFCEWVQMGMVGSL